jgi:tRNA threonylcarbamoyladenosine biosynthesis protein TsaE
VELSHILTSELDTKHLAERLATACGGGISIGLCGDLGAGKTTLVRFLVWALGGSEGQVSSPSFALQNEYRLTSGLSVEHWDLYRLRDLPMELLEPPGRDVIRIVEWPDKVPGYTQSLDLVASFSVQETGDRMVKFSGTEAQRFALLAKKV